MDKPESGGATKRDHLEQVERQTGKRLEELTPPVEFPILLSHIWFAFCALSDSRPPSFSGISPLPYSEIDSWMRVTENKLLPRDVETLKELDRIFVRVNNVRHEV